MPQMIAGQKEVVVTVPSGLAKTPADGRRYNTLRTAVLHHNQWRDRTGKGARQWPTWLIECEGERYYISYNGRVWAGAPADWTPETVEVVVA